MQLAFLCPQFRLSDSRAMEVAFTSAIWPFKYVAPAWKGKSFTWSVSTPRLKAYFANQAVWRL
jgi:hypothetical protein